MARLGVAVVGCGEWGRNHVRAVAQHGGARLLHVVDTSEVRREVARELAPGASVSDDLAAALEDPRVEAVVVATPTPSHVPIARAAIAAGKHLLVEKPLAPTVALAADLAARARKARRVLMVGHLLLHHPAVRFLKRLVDRGGLGRLHYAYAQRTNLGRIRTDENVLMSLAPHDVAVLSHLFGAWPNAVSAQGAAYVQSKWEDVVFLTLRFPGGRLGHVHLSWLDPHKVRRLTLVGSRTMAVFDDMEPAEKIRVHDKGPVPPEPGSWAEALALRFGETRIPRLPAVEPLREQLKAFLRACRTGVVPLADAASGVATARVLDAAARSLRSRGREVAVR
jgi:predicted dehydrogenase